MKKAISYCAVAAVVSMVCSSCGNRRELEAAFNNAQGLASAGRYREAITQYEMVIKLDHLGDFGLKARMHIGEIYFKRLKEYDSAKSMYGMVRNMFPDTNQAGEAEAKLKEIETIVNIKTEALEEGDRLSEQGRFREALERYRRAESLQPGNPSIEERIESTRARYDTERKRVAAAAIGRGDVYLSQNKYDEAMKEFLEARELTPEDEELWDKIDIVRVKLEPMKRERFFEEALKGGPHLDMGDPAVIASLLDVLPPADDSGSTEGEVRNPKGSDIYVADFSILLPEYKHYFQGYKLMWLPGAKWSMVTCTPAGYSFPFLDMPMRDFEEFEKLCGGEKGVSARPRLNGEALIRILGRDAAGGLSVELVDARIKVPGRDYSYVLRKKEKPPRLQTSPP